MNPANEPHLSRDGVPLARPRRRWLWITALLIALVAAGVAIYIGFGSKSAAGRANRGLDPSQAVPVTAAPVTDQALQHTLTALGTVTARSTVTVNVLVDGTLTQVLFHEGQLVHQGDLLAQIDPRPFEAALANAKAALQRDDAQLQDALLDLERYRGLSAEDSIPRQQLDTQEALAKQLKGTVAADRAQIQTAELNLVYTHVTAPTSGRVGLRTVDQGNVVHAATTTGLVVITEVQPIDVVFPIPQDEVPEVLRHMRAGGAKLAVDAYDRDGHTLLGTGALLATDNLIDTTTGTLKLKAEFPNRDLGLFPNQFVNVRLRLESFPHALTMPTAAVQRGAPGKYVYLVQKDGTVTLRTPKLGFTEGDRVQILDGLALNDQVVVDGTDKLREGARVELIDPKAAASASTKGGADHPQRPGEGTNPAPASAGKDAGDTKKQHD